MAGKNAEVPTNRCGFELQPDEVGFSYDRSLWARKTNPVCCYRSVWEFNNETDRCIWHADVDDKSLADLISARADTTERLDGAILRGITDNDERLSFSGCGLIGSIFENSEFQQKQFTDADLRWATFTDADFPGCKFIDINFRNAKFMDTNLRRAKFSYTDLQWAEFSHTSLQNAKFTKSNLSDARITDTAFREAKFIGSTLQWTKFTDAHLADVKFITKTDLSHAEFIDANLREAEFTDVDLPWAEFPHANLWGAKFTEAFLPDAEFPHADLTLAKFPNAYLPDTKFTDAQLRKAQFIDANLRDADFSDANARNVVFHHANLQNAVLTRTDCRRASFTSARLYETVFVDTRINSKTIFTRPETTFYKSIQGRPACVYEENDLMDHPESGPPLKAARWVYRRLETLHEDNALSEEARQFHISKEEAERALYWDQGKYRRWGVKTLMWYVTKHGESVKHVLSWWGIVIATGGVLFAGLGGVKNGNGTHYAITSPTELGTIAGWQEILWNGYFSVTTFSTIMDGGLAPVGPWTRAVVAVESITGALLVALLIFVLGRRVAR